ncbi:MAG: hypothetical protein ACMVO5_11255 [Polymorphobacter sp.]|uniref:hypothetical protein n=1 Tax=Polymorphobacter sp. TaxID=1909290 RepID=UPI003A87DFF0
MRTPLLITLLIAAAPAAACDLDYLPGFAGHSYTVGMDAEEAARAKEMAMANARAAFIKQYGLADPEPAPAAQAATTEVAEAAPAAPVASASMPAAYSLNR